MDESLFTVAVKRMEEMKLDKSIDMFYKWYDPLYSYTSFPSLSLINLHIYVFPQQPFIIDVDCY